MICNIKDCKTKLCSSPCQVVTNLPSQVMHTLAEQPILRS